MHLVILVERYRGAFVEAGFIDGAVEAGSEY